jgi:hypothetical protein
MNAPVHPLWGPQPTLTDGVIVLRSFEPRDAWAVFAWDDEEELAKWFDQPPLPPPDEHYRRCLWVITQWRRDYEQGSRAGFAVCDASNRGEAIGMVEVGGLQERDDRSASPTRPSRPGDGRASLRGLSVLPVLGHSRPLGSTASTLSTMRQTSCREL